MSSFIYLKVSIAVLVVWSALAQAMPSGGLNEGLLIEADVTQGAQTIAGRVLVEPGQSEWTKIASAPASTKTGRPALQLEARAKMVDSDVVEVETRVVGRDELMGKLLVQFGTRGELTMSQLESGSAPTTKTSPEVKSGDAGSANTSIGVKVLRVRYAL